MAAGVGRKSRSLPRGAVGRPRGAFPPGEGHLPLLGAMADVKPKCRCAESRLRRELEFSEYQIVHHEIAVRLNAFDSFNRGDAESCW